MFQSTQTNLPVNKGVCGFDFEEAIQIWNLKPQVANRRLAGAVALVPYVDLTYQQTEELPIYVETIYKRLCKDSEESDKSFNQFLIINQQELSAHLQLQMRYFLFHKELVTDTKTLRFWLRKLVPRCLDRYCATYELVLWKSGRLFCEFSCFSFFLFFFIINKTTITRIQIQTVRTYKRVSIPTRHK